MGYTQKHHRFLVLLNAWNTEIVMKAYFLYYSVYLHFSHSLYLTDLIRLLCYFYAVKFFLIFCNHITTGVHSECMFC